MSEKPKRKEYYHIRIPKPRWGIPKINTLRIFWAIWNVVWVVSVIDNYVQDIIPPVNLDTAMLPISFTFVMILTILMVRENRIENDE